VWDNGYLELVRVVQVYDQNGDPLYDGNGIPIRETYFTKGFYSG
jgi:hypothetical protein